MSVQPPLSQVPVRAGTVALIGRTNVGKSTLLNAALEQPLAIVSRKPQTTRNRLLGVVRHGGAEIGLIDTPGMHRPESGLGRAMNSTARQALREADLPIFVTALPRRPHKELHPHRDDLKLFASLPADRPSILVINKIDLLQDKRLLLPLIQRLSEARSFDAIVPISALRRDGVIRVLDEVARLLPPGGPQYADDEVTDRPLRFFAAEYVREPILDATQQEIPYSVAVTIDQFVEPPDDGPIHVAATIVAERQGQKRILVGKQGEMLRRIGITARKRLEELTGRQVVLKLWVRVVPNWRDLPKQLDELGYGTAMPSGPSPRRPRKPEGTQDPAADLAPPAHPRRKGRSARARRARHRGSSRTGGRRR